jgi:hypothetical protein
LLSLCTFGKWVREAYRQILRESGDDEFAKAVDNLFSGGSRLDLLITTFVLCLTGSWIPQRELLRMHFCAVTT